MAAVDLLPNESHATANVSLLTRLQQLSTATLGYVQSPHQDFERSSVIFSLFIIISSSKKTTTNKPCILSVLLSMHNEILHDGLADGCGASRGWKMLVVLWLKFWRKLSFQSLAPLLLLDCASRNLKVWSVSRLQILQQAREEKLQNLHFSETVSTQDKS